MMTVLGLGALCFAALGFLSREPKRKSLLPGNRIPNLPRRP